MENAEIRLEKVTWENYQKILKLRVHKEQKNFVATNRTSLIHAFLSSSEGIPVYAFGIYKDNAPIGFLQLNYSSDWTGNEREDWLSSQEYHRYEGKYYYYIWRFMIDKKYQGKGYGKQAFQAALDFIRTKPAGEAEYIALSYEPENVVAKNLYHSFGFEEHFAEYVEEGDETIALLRME
ncbi:MAG: GNAT family N-acetyltransferase [Bacilli bacterium]|nr:GNAT family N-acetyltransferase [Bacilli bacterium]